MSRRVAFLIGNQTFHKASGLQQLHGPLNDIRALGQLLRDPRRGGFIVNEFFDKPHYEVMAALNGGLNLASPGDLVLIYYSGHGKRDRNGALCLATSDTQDAMLQATSISTRTMREFVNSSDCDQVIMVLDCCYSGAVDDGLRGDVASELSAVNDARGFYILTATTALQPARETMMGGGGVMGRFTAAFIQAIESGTAKHSDTGQVFLSDVRAYVGETVKGQTSQFFSQHAVGDPLISYTSGPGPALLAQRAFSEPEGQQVSPDLPEPPPKPWYVKWRSAVSATVLLVALLIWQPWSPSPSLPPPTMPSGPCELPASGRSFNIPFSLRGVTLDVGSLPMIISASCVMERYGTARAQVIGSDEFASRGGESRAQSRADAVSNALIKQGIASNRIGVSTKIPQPMRILLYKNEFGDFAQVYIVRDPAPK